MYSRALEQKPARSNTAFGFSALNQWLWSTSIVTQMGRLFNVFAILAVVIASLALSGTYRMDQRADRLAEFTKVAFLTAKMNRQVNLAKDDFGAYRVYGFDPELLDQAIQHTRNAQAAATELRADAEPLSPAYLANLEDIAANLQRGERMLAEAAEIPPGALNDEALLAPRYEALDQANASIETLREIAEQRANEMTGEGMEETESLMLALGSALIVSIGMAMGGKSFVARRLIAPITEISEVSSRISAGASDLQIPGTERQDEIGKLAHSLEVLRGVQAQAASKAMSELEDQKALEQERKRQESEKAKLLESLAQSFEESIGDVALEVANASDDVNSAAQSLTSTVERSSRRVEMASKSLSEATHGMTSAAAASDEFALSISEVSSQASVSSERAKKAAEAAKSADETISELTNSAEKISQIVELISRIAQRTNLLALNASIEAARNAEAGRGFAVVANEVKELAAQTHRETARVESLIVSMQNATGQSASALSTIAQEVIELQSASSAIASAVDQQAGAGQALAQAIDLAANNTVQFGDSITDVRGMMSASKMTAEQLSDSSDRLNAQIGRLRRQVTEFLEQVRSA